MKFAINRETLNEALTVALAAVPTRTPKDVLKNVHLRVEGDMLILTASDTEIELQTRVPVEDAAPGCCLVNDRLRAICRESVGEVVRLQVKDEIIQVSCGLSNFELQSGDADEFPAFQELKADAEIELGMDNLRSAIGLTVFACDEAATRYALGGVLFELGGGGLELVATDSRRLSVAYAGDAPGTQTGAVVPARACTLLSRMSGEQVKMSFGTNAVSFAGEGWRLNARLVEGRFPRYQDVMLRDGTKCDVDLVIPVNTLARAVRQTEIVHSKETHGGDFRFAAGELTITGSGSDVGSAKAVLPVGYDGEPVVVTLDTRYVLDFLKRLPQDEAVELKFSGTSATYWSSGKTRYVVMPLSNKD